MKKAIILSSIACAFVSSYAATANWAAVASNIYDGRGDSSLKVAAGTPVYIFDSALMSQEQLFQAFSASPLMDFTKAVGYATKTALSVAGGMVAASTAFAYGSQSTDEKISSYSFYFAIVDGEKIYLSSDLEKLANKNDNIVSLLYGSQSDGSKVTTDGFVSVGQWSQVSGGDVPEPTTCSLLLVGLAGMGLKRLRKRGKKSA